MRLYIFLLCVCALLFSNCGIEDYAYIYPVRDADITKTGNYHVKFNYPDSSGNSAGIVEIDFTSGQHPRISITQPGYDFYENYEIYYRIYISPSIEGSPSEANYSNINTQLSNDYNAIKPYTDETNNNASYGYSSLTSRSYMTINEDSTIYLLRSKSLSTPYPNPTNKALWYFENDVDLRNSSYLNSNNNADVASSPSAGAYTYVSMYVVHTAFEAVNLNTRYSTPKHLGVFLLPDSSATP